MREGEGSYPMQYIKQAEGSMFARYGVLHPNATSVLQEDMHAIIAGQSTYRKSHRGGVISVISSRAVLISPHHPRSSIDAYLTG